MSTPVSKYSDKQKEMLHKLFTENPDISLDEFRRKTGFRNASLRNLAQVKYYNYTRRLDPVKRGYKRKSNGPLFLKLFEIPITGMSQETKSIVKQIFVQLNECKKFNLNAVELVDPAVFEIREVAR